MHAGQPLTRGLAKNQIISAGKAWHLLTPITGQMPNWYKAKSLIRNKIVTRFRWLRGHKIGCRVNLAKADIKTAWAKADKKTTRDAHVEEGKKK
jgi:ribosomal protein L5